ncbi:MAG: polysaccharide pyruvyl transferase family protein [Candidatus Auribacterota bacterium]
MKKRATIDTTCLHNLCTSCGTCEMLCPVKAISMSFRNGQFIPSIDYTKCTLCGICAGICQGLDFLSPDLTGTDTPVPHYTDQIESIIRHDSYIAAYNAWTKDMEIRKHSVSGGMVTTLIYQLLAHQEYTEAFVLQFDTFSGTQAQFQPVTDPAQAMTSAGSHYIPVSLASIVSTIRSHPGRKYILVGTSCQFAALRKVFAHLRYDTGSLLFLGLFCHQTLNYNVLSALTKWYGKRSDSLQKIQFRSKEKGGWPGDIKLTFSSGKTVFVDEDIRLKSKKYFALNRCLFCIDKFNLHADISFGDCYIPEDKDPLGKSNIIVRTEKGRDILARHSQYFHLEPVDIEAIKKSQDYYKEKTERLEYALLMGAALNGQLAELQKLQRFKNAAKKLSRRQRFLKWGADNRLNRIYTSIRLSRLKENATIIWHKQTFTFYWALLTGLWCWIRYRHRPRSSGHYVLINGGELFNKGAQAMTFTVIDAIRKRHPDKQCVLLSFRDYERSDTEKEQFTFDIVPLDFNLKMCMAMPLNRLFFARRFKKAEKSVMSIMKNASCIIDISGFALSSQFGDSKALGYLMTLILARKYHIPYILLPQSFGPLSFSTSRKPAIKMLSRLYLPTAHTIYAREEESLRTLHSLNLKNVSKSPDIVLMNEQYDLTNIYTHSPADQFDKLERPAVCIIPNMNVFNHLGSTTFYEMYKKIIERLIEKEFHVYIVSHAEDDQYICRKIAAMFDASVAVTCLSDNYNPLQLEQIIRQSRFVVASRYHGIVHAYKNGIPAVVIGWAVKYDELLGSFGQNQYGIDCRACLSSPDTLLNKISSCIDDMIKNCSQERKTIKDKMTELLTLPSPFDEISRAIELYSKS